MSPDDIKWTDPNGNSFTLEQLRELVYGPEDPVQAGLMIAIMGLFLVGFGIAILAKASKD
jgi:hypothetical protein